MTIGFAHTENEMTVTAMAEYIACRSCESPDCKGCNLKRLETMLENGKFDCLMNENRCINTSADVEPVKRGRWIAKQTALGTKYTVCSNCGYGISIPLDGHLSKLDLSDVPRCPNCGARMDLEADHAQE